MTPFMTGTTSSITVQNFGKIVQRAPAVGAKMWCFFCHASGPERLAFEGCIVRTHIQLCVRTIEHTIADFDAVYSVFFGRDCAFR